MKSILLSIKPEWLAKILNEKKTIEVRKLFPKDYVGWVYLYCSKGNKKNWHLIEVVNPDTGWEGYEYDYYIGSKGYLDWCLEGKVVARFWCDKVEKITVTFERTQMGYFGFGLWANYFTITTDQDYLMSKSNLSYHELDNYLNKKCGYAIHISKLEIFDRPKELGDFHTVNKYGIPQYQFGKGTCDYKKLTKAPQNYCYIYDFFFDNEETKEPESVLIDEKEADGFCG